MTRYQVIGFALLVGGVLLGAIGWAFTGARGNEVYGLMWAFIGLMALLSGGMLLARVSKE